MLRQVFVLLALLFCLSYVHAQVQTTNTSDFRVSIGNYLGRPQWQYSQNDNSSYVYTVTLSGMWEVENSTYDLVAGSSVPQVNLGYGWVVTNKGIVNNSQQYSVETTMVPSDRYSSLSFNTHIPLGAVNGSSYPAAKFDIGVKDYKWVSTSDSAQLVVAFQVGFSNNGYSKEMDNLTTHGSRTADFADAYFSINSTAQAGSSLNTSVAATLKLATAIDSSKVPAFDKYSIYIIYDHFDSNLFHDPEIGFGEGPGNSYIWIIIIVVVVVAIIVIILIAIIGFVLVRRRRRSYDAF